MRSNTSRTRWVSVLLAVVVAAIFAYARAAPSQSANESPTTQAASKAAPMADTAPTGKATEPRDAIHASNQRVLQASIGREVTVTGEVARAAKSQSGIHFLNLENSSLSIVCFRDDAQKFADGSPSDQFRDHDIEIRGKLEQYKGKLQIKLVDPSQIRIIEDASPGSTQPEGIVLKEIGRNTWLSPAGLRYAGRDPQGLTRKEHIERHVKDDPDRDGSHGVFDGGSAVAFAVIDEAWQRAEKTNLRATKEGDRSSLLVPMGRRVGYLGGRTGNARQHPALKRVFIVFETGTKNVVTAFPR
jgi:hypothetical protein